MNATVEFESLVGKTIVKIEGNEESEGLKFFTNDSEIYCMYHNQDCCESVNIEDICGDLDWLIDSPIVLAEERTQDNEKGSECGMWTFYELATTKGSVTIRWYGESDYYSVSVDFYKKDND